MVGEPSDLLRISQAPKSSTPEMTFGWTSHGVREPTRYTGLRHPSGAWQSMMSNR